LGAFGYLKKAETLFKCHDGAVVLPLEERNFILVLLLLLSRPVAGLFQLV
jgi:hypothetical protein